MIKNRITLLTLSLLLAILGFLCASKASASTSFNYPSPQTLDFLNTNSWTITTTSPTDYLLFRDGVLVGGNSSPATFGPTPFVGHWKIIECDSTISGASCNGALSLADQLANPGTTSVTDYDITDFCTGSNDYCFLWILTTNLSTRLLVFWFFTLGIVALGTRWIKKSTQ